MAAPAPRHLHLVMESRPLTRVSSPATIPRVLPVILLVLGLTGLNAQTSVPKAGSVRVSSASSPEQLATVELVQAVRIGDLARAETALAAAPTLLADVPGRQSLLNLAAREGHPAIVRWLLEKGATPNDPSNRVLPLAAALDWTRDISMQRAEGSPEAWKMAEQFSRETGKTGSLSASISRRSKEIPMKVSHPTAFPAQASSLARRDLRSFTASTEKKVLVALAKRLPPWVGPDHLTALGVLAMAGAGICYRLSAVTSLALLGVNFCLFLNWFGDSLDGTLARVRDQQRPRYGFYVDHLVDAFGAIFLLSGLAASGLVSVLPAVAVLTVYLLLQIHIALKAHATSVFQIAFGGIGGTEARILLAALNLGLMFEPALIPTLEPFLWLVAGGLLGLVVWDGVATGRALDREERSY